MHRAEARMRTLRRVGPLVLGALVLGNGAFFIARAFKSPEQTNESTTVAPSAARSAKPKVSAPSTLSHAASGHASAAADA